MSDTEVKVDQVWERKDPRESVQVQVVSVNRFHVVVKGRRRSTIRRERFPQDYRLIKDV